MKLKRTNVQSAFMHRRSKALTEMMKLLNLKNGEKFLALRPRQAISSGRVKSNESAMEARKAKICRGTHNGR